MDSAANPVCLQSQVHISAVAVVNVVLVEDIVETLVEVLQVEQNDCSPSFHANLDLIDVAANL